MDFRAAEREVQRHSAELKKELRLGDLVLTQILFITGLFWFGTAGKLGSSHIMFWIPAVLLFYIPCGMVVVHLNQEMPLEGGIYQWAKLRFGDGVGFLVAWNIWASTVLSLAMLTSQLTDNLAAAFGPSGAWIAESKWATVISGAVMMSGLMLVAVRGLALGRWIHDAGGITLIVIPAAMALFALPRWFHGEVAGAPAAFSIPAVSLLNLNILGKVSFGAFFGFDGAAIFSGECRDPHVARSIRRSVWLAAPVIALIYILGTSCVLVFTRPDSINLISPTTQALTRGAEEMGIGGVIGPLAAVLLICHVVAYSSLSYNAVIRLPMVAGWDHLLPAWLSRLHPRYKTPVGSIVFIGVMALVFIILGNLGVGAQEAFQLLGNGSFICYALTYLVMFAIPLIARGEKPAWGLRLAAASGFAMTLLYTVLSIFPIIDVQNAASFTMKISGVVIAINLAGALYFRHAKKRKQTLSPA
jgi:glutamate:GABA antiporter